MNGREAGTFSRDITKAKDGRWTFYDSQVLIWNIYKIHIATLEQLSKTNFLLKAKLNVGDVLYYWTYVDYFDGTRKLGYPKDDQFFVVKGNKSDNWFAKI